jgi:Ca2+-binding RTX toxin-like protein
MATLAKSVLAGPGVILPGWNLGLYIEGTNLNDHLYGTASADEIHGRSGNDFLSGGAGDDLLFGEQGNDSLSGGSGNDRLDGGAGDDAMVGGAGADTFIGGGGFDTVSYASASTAVSINVGGVSAIGDAQGDTYSDIDKVVGSSFSDTFIADDSGIAIDGGAGNDDIWGGAGIDVINGGTGDDWIEGGRGLDVLTGGTGNDHFVFNRGDGPDVVTDFQSGTDKIVLRAGLDFLPFGRDFELWTGTEPPSSPPHQGGGYHREDKLFYDTDDHQLYYLHPWDGPTLLAAFANSVQLQTSDFIV